MIDAVAESREPLLETSATPIGARHRFHRRRWIGPIAWVLASLACTQPGWAAPSNLVTSVTRIADAEMGGIIDNYDRFSTGIEPLGDLNGNGYLDVALGAFGDDDGGGDSGAVYLIELDTDGTLVPGSIVKLSKSTYPAILTFAAPAEFGIDLALLGDYDGDGFIELAVGATKGEESGAPAESGQVWILDIDPTTRTLDSAFSIGSGTANFATFTSNDRFGRGLAELGDWDGDGAPELLAGAFWGDDGGSNNGAAYIIYLEPPALPGTNATGVKGFVKLSATSGGFGGGFDSPTLFGFGGDAIGDLDGDGQIDLAIGAPLRGASGSVWITYMDPGCSVGPGSCSVKSETEIAEDVGGLNFGISGNSYFGLSIAWSPDSGDLFPRRLVVGAHNADYGGQADRGAAFLIGLSSSGAVASQQLISSSFNGMQALSAYARFGYEVAQADVNGDTLPDLLVGTYTENLGGNLEQGAFRTLFLDPCPVVTTNTRIYHSPNDDGTDICVPVQLGAEANPTLHLYADSGDLLTANPADVCVEGLGEGDEICGLELRLDLEGYEATGFTSAIPSAVTNASQLPASEFRFVWLPTTAGVGPVKLGDLQLTQTGGDASIKIQSGTAAIDASLLLERVADTVVALPEPGRAVGLLAGLLGLIFITRRRAARLSRGLGAIAAAFFLLSLFTVPGTANAEISVKSWKTIGVTWPAGSGNARLGSGLANVGDIDQDGVPDVIAGAPRNGGCDGGEVSYLHFIDRDATLTGRAGPITESNDQLGRSFVSIGDLDGDGIAEVAAGLPSCVSGQIGSNPLESEGAVLILSFDNTGNEKSRVKIAEGLGGFGGTLDPDDQLGVSVGTLGDVDGDGNVEIVVGAPGDDDGLTNAGAVWIMSIEPSGQVAWQQKISSTEGGFGGSLSANDSFGIRAVGIGDLDGNGVPDLAVSAPFRNDGGLSDTGEVWILFLDSSGPGNVSVIGQQEISRTEGGLTSSPGYIEAPIGAGQGFGYGLASQPIPDGGGRSILYVGIKDIGGNNPLFVLLLNTDGTVYSSYVILETNGVGFDPSQPNNISALGHDISVMGDLDGDEVIDIVVGAPWDAAAGAPDGYIVFMYMQDSDFDGLDDNLDNCPNVSNSQQEDADGDGVGDLCDNCIDIVNATQDDLDVDGEGDACEPVELLLQTTGTPVSPSWDLSLQCGAFDVTSLNAAIVLPSGSTAPQTLTLSGASVGTPSTSGPGLVSPQRDDAIYFSAAGNGAPDNRLCSALDAPVPLGTLTTGPIGGTQLAAAALSAEGVGTPGFGLDLAVTAGGAVTVTEIRLVNGLPLPVANLELGPAVETGGGTRWEVCLTGTEEFHRVAFGLIAPTGTTTSNMRWVGCDTAPGVNDERLCAGGAGFSPYTEATTSWTVGPSAAPSGDLLPHTMYVVLEGNRFSSGVLGQPATMNFPDEPVCIGAVELDGSPDLEPAITNDGVNDIDDAFGAGKVTPYEQVLLGSLDPTQVKLIGQFNPAVDLDGDGVQDLADNCPFQSNPAQANRGSFLDATDESDPFGDACQCAEATDDGAVLDPDDFAEIFDYLAGNPTTTPAAEIEARCSVAGTTECNIRDLVFLKQAIDAASTVVDLRCDAALSPPNLP